MSREQGSRSCKGENEHSRLSPHEHPCVLTWQGPVYELVIAGGACTEDLYSGVVTCTAPSVALTKTPGACNLKYTSPDVVQVPGCSQPYLCTPNLSLETLKQHANPAQCSSHARVVLGIQRGWVRAQV